MPIPRGLRTVITLISLGMGAAAVGQQATWYPSPWGAEDQRGAANRLTPQKVLEAKQLINAGQVYPLGRLYEPGIPVFGHRHYSLRIPHTSGPLGSNAVTYHEEIISGKLGQIGTQFDGLGHIGIGDRFYNGRLRDEFVSAEGLTQLGVEHVGVFVTRGVLIDLAAYKAVKSLKDDDEISAADIKGALQRQGSAIRPGDVVVLHTGWGALWMKDNARYTQREPGLGVEAAQFLVEQGIVMVCADTWGVEVVPNPDASLMFPAHQLLLTKNGIYLLENLATEALAQDKVYEFAFFYAPLRLKGATGSPGNPVAIR